MSTNFYIVNKNPGAPGAIHIGKRSVGWVFGFSAIEAKTTQGWVDRTINMREGEEIQDEYGTAYSPQEFWAEVDATRFWQARPGNSEHDTRSGRNWMDGGYRFSNYEFS